VFLAAAGLASVGIALVIWRKPGLSRARTVVPLGFVLGGALGNLLDRAVHGYVIDFIHWHWNAWSWPPFNLADAGIVVGVLVVLLFGSRQETRELTGAASHKKNASSRAASNKKRQAVSP